jgi:hypothetical protein
MVFEITERENIDLSDGNPYQKHELVESDLYLSGLTIKIDRMFIRQISKTSQRR